MKRNDPCSCGSGKKYKKCCLERDRSLAQKERQERREEEEERRKEEEKEVKRKRVEREDFKDSLDRLGEEVLIEGAKNRIANYLKREGPTSKNMIQDIHLLYQLSHQRNEYVFIYQFIEHLREKYPPQYREIMPFLWGSLFGVSFALKKWDLITDSISCLHPKKEASFFQIIKNLFYFGDIHLLNRLCDHLRDIVPEYKGSYTLFKHTTEDVYHSMVDTITICSLVRDPSITAEELFSELTPYLHRRFDERWVSLNILEPMQRGLPLTKKFLKDPGKESMLYSLGWSLTSTLSKKCKIPLSRSLLGVQCLQLLLHQEDRGENEEGDGYPLIPREELITTRSIARNIYIEYAFLEIASDYFNLLERENLLCKKEASGIDKRLLDRTRNTFFEGTVFGPFDNSIKERIEKIYKK